MKKYWVQFRTPIDMDDLPRLLYAGTDIVTDASYCWKGTERPPGERVVFQFTREGEGRLSWQERTLILDRGTAFCYDLADPSFSYYYPPEGTDAWSFTYCVFVGMTDIVSRLVATHGPVFHLGETSLAIKKLQALVESVETSPVALDASQHFALCATIVGELVRCAENRHDGEKRHTLVGQAGALIQARCTMPFHLDALASELGVTPEHLCRAFRAQHGVTPKGYHDELRLGWICERLLNSPATIKEIALAAGFTDLSHFTKFFKKHRGVTPGDFRRHSIFRY
ncbi:MAG TPA: AraC family transcriptional regulator [Armatimonadota bacterium]|nr:AraC family transcriptional regulator [Armatimonadota bacterium]